MDREQTLNDIAVIKERMRELVEKAESEKRELTADETAEYGKMKADIEEKRAALAEPDDTAETTESRNSDSKNKKSIDMRKLKEVWAEQLRAVAENRSVAEYDNVHGNQIELRADPTKYANIDDIQSEERLPILEPLNDALVLGKVGVTVINTAKNVTVPSVNNVTASIEGETTALTGKTLDFSKRKVTPKRVGISMPFSGAAVRHADIDLISYAINLAGKATGQLINKWIVSPKGVTGTDTTVAKGPFVDLYTAATAAKASWENILALETAIKSRNVEFDDTVAFVISPATEQKLKSMPVALKGANTAAQFALQDGKIDGIPVIVTQAVVDGDADYIGLGVWSNVLINTVGDPTLVVDNLSRSKEDIVEVNLNHEVAVDVLRPEAFAVLKLDNKSWTA